MLPQVGDDDLRTLSTLDAGRSRRRLAGIVVTEPSPGGCNLRSDGSVVLPEIEGAGVASRVGEALDLVSLPVSHTERM